jgi:sugar-specific transcriptional regulator TrmB
MYKDLFTQLGLSINESIVYEYLLKNGESPAGAIIKKTPLKRGVIYNCLEDLTKKDLITEQRIAKTKGGGKISYFSPNHPQKLEEYVESEKARLEKVQKTLDLSLPAILSDFNLVSGKPGVKFYEGLDGVKKVTEVSLTAKSTIYSYADIEAIEKYVSKINHDYVQKREKLGIKKMGIVIDSPFTRKYLKDYHREITDTRFIDYKLFPFNTVMQIYDDKISYVTLSEKNKIGILIEDKNICQMHKSLFEFTWQHAKPL